jgi:uncharacterized membrane protein
MMITVSGFKLGTRAHIKAKEDKKDSTFMDNIPRTINRFKAQHKTIIYAILAAPLSIILHEVGHALAEISVGYAEVFITYHSWGGKQPIGITSVDRAWINTGEPAASFLIIIACILLIRFKGKTVFPRVLGMLAPVQFMGTLLFILSSIIGLNGSKVYDAARAAHNLGISVFTASIPGSIVLIVSWIFFIRSFDENVRIRETLRVIGGGILGFLLWFTFIGQIIFPD